MLAEAAEEFVLVADQRKDSKVLGTNWKRGVPIEVAPFAWAKVMRNIQKMGCPDPVRTLSNLPSEKKGGGFDVLFAPWPDAHTAIEDGKGKSRTGRDGQTETSVSTPPFPNPTCGILMSSCTNSRCASPFFLFFSSVFLPPSLNLFRLTFLALLAG